MARATLTISCPGPLLEAARKAGLSPSAVFQDAVRLTLADRRKRLPSELLAAKERQFNRQTTKLRPTG